ncbi:MAG: DHH family phosphoesterase [Thermoplasmata archaeon]|nr:MAG: DHH family phosphoesterase [Thermoplasmata archaeon]
MNPFLAISYNDDIDISARATQDMVENGINLGEAMRNAAQAIGGEGGGHPVAAGASIPKGKEEEFLKLLDELL